MITKSYNIESFYNHCDISYSVYGHKIIVNNRDMCIDIGDTFTFDCIVYGLEDDHHIISATVYNITRGPTSTAYYTTVTGLPCSNGIPINTFENAIYTPDYISYTWLGGGYNSVKMYVGWGGTPRIYYGESISPGRDVWLSFDILIESDLDLYNNGHAAIVREGNNTMGSYTGLTITGPGKLSGTMYVYPTSYPNYTCTIGRLAGGYLYIQLYQVGSTHASYINVTLSNVCYKNYHYEIMPSDMCIPANKTTLISAP